ncbi:MAG TPA: twin-arginine translocation signal domain-containing protein [Armatimonadota bacterium]|nr:twin-arginine translocation signal domain-containing protein [Armatimonadota bacterium]
MITRRDFMRGAISAAALTATGLPVLAEKRSKVVLIRDAGVLDADGKIRPEVLARMLDTAVAKLLGKPDAASAWKLLVSPKDFVGIKSNHWERLKTPVELEKIIQQRINSAGVPAGKVFCDDRGSKDKFQQSTALINVRPARTHKMSGMGSCIKNYIILTPKPSDYHPDACSSLATVWDLPIVKGKTRLNILVLLQPLFYARGPQNFEPQYLWPYNGLAVSLDPVAVDAVGANLLKTKRIKYFGEDQPITPTKHIDLADTKYGLGVSDLNRIDLIKLGWMKDILI